MREGDAVASIEECRSGTQNVMFTGETHCSKLAKTPTNLPLAKQESLKNEID